MGTFILKRKLFGGGPGAFNLVGNFKNFFKQSGNVSRLAGKRGAMTAGTKANTNLLAGQKEYEAARSGLRNSVLTYGALGGTVYGVGSYASNKYDTMTGEKFENDNYKSSDWGI